MTKFIIRILVLSLLLVFTVKAQIKKIGVPFITNYNSKTYKAASENWDVLQNSKGMMFFANHFGIMQFDGVRWTIVTQPENRSMVRSLAIDRSDKIYVGAQGDFGSVIQLCNGQYQYTSLLKLVPDSARNFGDVVHTVIHNNEVVFFSYEAIFIYKNNKIKVFKAKNNFEDFYEVNKKIYVLDKEKGLLQLKDDVLKPISSGEKFAGMKIRKIFETQNGLLLFTQKNGLFIFKDNQIQPFVTEADYLLKQNQITAAVELSDGYFGVGTRQSGLIVLDRSGHLIQHINKQMGLQNEYVTNLKVDKEGNLWVTLKEGISLIQISSPLSRVLDTSNSETKIYCSQIYQNKLYIATDNGLFWLDWQAYKNGKRENANFQHISGMSENVWNIGVFGNSLLAFEKNGIFEVSGNSAKLLAKTDGAWKGILVPNRPDLLLAGGYNGLYLLKKINNSWVYQHKIKGFEESSRIIETDKNGDIWIAHGYKGIFKLRFNTTFDAVLKVEFYNEKNGFPSSLFLNTFKIDDQILFGTTKGVYKQNSDSGKMIPDSDFKKYLGLKSHIRLLKPDNQHTIWYISGENTGKMTKTNSGFEVEELPFRKLRYLYVPGFENIQTTPNGDVFFGTQDGLIHYNAVKNKKYQTKYKALISEVKCIFPKDSLIFSSRYDVLSSKEISNDETLSPVLSYANNALHFSFSSLFYDEADATQYEYWLEGFEPKWSEYSLQTEKEYTNLPENEYVFHVRAKNIYDVVSEEAVFRFEISPPWYRTIWAYILYFILYSVVIYLIIKYQKSLAERDRQRLILNQEKELLRSRAELNEQKLTLEQENMNIIRENLQTTINLKNAKVASSTVNLIHLNEILLSIKELIAQMDKKNDANVNFSLLSKINKVIDHELQGDKQWNEFEEIFNQLHDNFMQRLKTSYPELTPRDMRLCAYLRMNFNTKEIAPLLGISVRGVEDTRYRIRKKLQLPSDANITEFILNF
ncbi:ligand-binding sensor domain-containing protein/DNA-binding CsgD family transcriptional regulator [Flavobacterium sp. HSC-32F16]|uniref:ligand-binding sensor domain-containing protein n=1 Tax=Flavobacterium sp. HSC-32F16 TaxID=2910964 RepID=UPI0020A2DF31|nr:triple tyrosine motif-containing protein [Flavobacterium sp. HSC-32F16]MCP2028281.1 ligand-binding sensor domain-containing protein/DNA-binding CsgD family transcriptional regulator [Flavobacterium sp. HSC-32F16]